MITSQGLHLKNTDISAPEVINYPWFLSSVLQWLPSRFYFYLYVCVCHVCVGAHIGQKKVSDPLEQQLKAVMSHLIYK